ncbi:MAG: 1-phosphofructokinase family hexose kinase [Pseudomonadota bacterium]
MSVIATITLNPALDIAAAAPEVKPTIKVRCGVPTVQAGGGGINVARVAERFGASARPILLTGGASGDRLVALLKAEGLTPVNVPIAGETRESFTVNEAATHEQYRFVLPGPTVDGAEAEAVLVALKALDPLPEIVVFSGSHPPGLPASFAADLASATAAVGARFIVDGPAAILEHTHSADLVKPNERELSDLVGRPLGTTEAIFGAAREIIAGDMTDAVLVSMGEAGALLVTEAGATHYSVPKLELVSAVGAGDSMVGALSAALASGKDLVEAAAIGAAAGSAAIMTPGTDLCRPEDAERLLPSIETSPYIP